MSNIFELTTELKNAYSKLESGEYIDMETGEIDEQVYNALQISERNLQAKAIDYGYCIKSLGDEIEKYDKMIKLFTERKKQLEKTQETLKNNLSNAMLQFGIVEIKDTFVKLSFRKSESVEIVNENELPDEYITKKTTIVPDKTAIKKALKNGENVSGATLITKDNLQVKL